MANPSCDEAAALVSNGSSPALIGPEMTPVRWEQDIPWVVIGTQSDADILAKLHDVAGWAPPTITEIIPESAWTRIARRDGHRMLALNPSDNVSASCVYATSTPLSICAHPWNPSRGLICEGDTLTTIQLTGGSVNT